MKPSFYPLNRATLSLPILLLMLSALTFQSQAQSGSVTTTQSFSYTGQIVIWTVPTGVSSLTVEARGAEGAAGGTYAPGKGAIIKGTISVTPGQPLSILVGQQPVSIGGATTTGGGGGSFIVRGSSPVQPLLIAGGGGGGGGGNNSANLDSNTKNGQAGNNGGAATAQSGAGTGGTAGNGGKAGSGQFAAGGGGGLLTDGTSSGIRPGGKAFVNGGAGGRQDQTGDNGGFGGGGSGFVIFDGGNAYLAGGGGGGYSGGGGSSVNNSAGVGGGGGSFNAGTNQVNTAGVNSGNGLVIITYATPPQPIRYVKQGGSGTGDGTSWANASGDLQSQIDIAGAQQVWVAGGRYTTAQNSGSFVMKNGVAIYGGFAGGENSLGNRPGVNPVVGSISSTTLTAGSGGGSVIANNGVSNTARLDGVVITGGSSADYGGGISNQSSSPVLINCLISGNVTDRNGGGLGNIGGIPILINCVISNNSSNLGGGIYNFSSSPMLINCVIRGNSANNSGGGIINESRSSPTLTNCVLSNNTANYGGGIYSGGSSRPNIQGCTLAGNRAGVGGALVNYSSSQPVLTNSILWDNQESANTAIDNDTGTDVTANYCLIGQGESSFTGSNTLVATVSPFVSGSDFQLSACSVAIDAGNPSSSTTTSGATDLVGNPRFYQGGRIDIGAYEFQGSPAQPLAITRQPASGSSVTAGASVSVPVSVSGTVSGYQWYKDNLSSPVTGQTSATLTLTNVQTAQAGSYSLVVTGTCNSVTSTAFSLSVSPAQPIRYVRQGGTGDGTSWANASGDLQSQIDITGAQQVYVAGGTYSAMANSGSFVMKNGVAIYGGFSSTNPENSPANRPSVNPVSGSPSTSTLTTTSTTQAVVNNNGNALTSSAVLDGFVITGGNNAPNGRGKGGGMYNLNGSPTLVNLRFSQNQAQFGGGIFNELSSPALSNCDFSQNQSTSQGGGIYNDRSSPAITSVRFSQNTTGGGGGVYNDQSNSTLINCTFIGNSGTSYGGGMVNISSTPSLINCTFTANQSSGAALFQDINSSPVLTNTILWDNQGQNAIVNQDNSSVTANYCLIGQGETDFTGSNNLIATTSPFVSATNLQLNACAPAIDAGSNAAYTGPATDLAGNPRPVRQVDMGAYEFQGTPAQPVAITRQPVSGSSVTAGASVSVPVSVSGSVSGYQWYKDNLNSPVTGQTSATLTLTNVQLSDAGSYSLVVTGTCNSVTSTAFSLSVSPAQPIRYVRQGGTGDGTSWANASGDLQSQIDIAGAQQVWVAGGRYTTTSNGGSFVMKNGVAIYGGFGGQRE